MSTHTYEELANLPHQLYKYWNSGEMDKFYEMIHPNVIDHNAGESETGRAGVKKALDTVRSAFPDSIYKVLDVIVDEKRQTITAFLEIEGTQTGELFGVPPSGKKAKWKEMRIAHMVDGMTKDHWAILDSLSMMRQLGHVVDKNETDRENW